jgi:hypothetical protein
MRNKYVHLFILTILLSSCSKYPKSFVYKDYSDEIIFSFIEWACNKYKMKVQGSGGMYLNCVRQISVDFIYEGVVCKEEVLVIYYDCVKELIKRINQNEKIRPFLINYPVSKENVSVKISFYNPNGWLRPPKGEIARITPIEEDLYFSTFNHEKGCLEILYNEPYELSNN